VNQHDRAEDERNQRERHPARADAQEEQQPAAELGGDREVGEQSGHAEGLEVLHGARNGKYPDLEPGMSEEHDRERKAQQQRGNVHEFGVSHLRFLLK
jgi:hypothetical protein